MIEDRLNKLVDAEVTDIIDKRKALNAFRSQHAKLCVKPQVVRREVVAKLKQCAADGSLKSKGLTEAVKGTLGALAMLLASSPAHGAYQMADQPGPILVWVLLVCLLGFPACLICSALFAIGANSQRGYDVRNRLVAWAIFFGLLSLGMVGVGGLIVYGG